MQIRLLDIAAAAAGVVLFDFVFCQLVAPKILNALELRAERERDCHCGGGCDSCAKNITDRAQVIDVTAINRQGVALLN